MSYLLFSEFDLSAVLRRQIEMLRQDVYGCAEDYLLNVSETDFVNHLVMKFRVDAPEIGEPFMLEPREVDVDVSHDPMWGRRRGDAPHVKGCRIEIHVPFSGDHELFKCQPSSFTLNPPRADVRHDHLALIYDRPGALRPEEVKPGFEQAMGEIRRYLGNIKQDCAPFNSTLEENAKQIFTARKLRILSNRKAGAGFGLPIKRRENSPQTYVVPGVVRKPTIERPAVKTKGFVHEPTLAQQEYDNILSITRNMVNVMERSPKAFAHMGEEDLRTHFLVQLNGQYQGRATGETFNYEGKTDILIREGDRNVFIAECKIWNGETELGKAIDQVLGYLHWKDTKAALLVFNRNKSLSDVLAKIESTVTAHQCFKKLLTKVNETEWRFLFRNRDDANRELHLAVLVFDVPKETK